MNQLNIASLLRLVVRDIREYGSRWSTAEGLHVGQLLMMVLLKQRGPSRQSDMARELEISPATTAVTIQRMEKKGLVARIPAEKGRGHRIMLTPLGIDMEERGFQHWMSLNQVLTANLTSEEEHTLRHLLLKVRENFNNPEPSRFLFMEERLNAATEASASTTETCLEGTYRYRKKTKHRL